MSSHSTPASDAQTDFCFRCIGCGDVSHAAGQDFRCSHCEDLLEIIYPGWKNAKPDAQKLKSAWAQRRLSNSALDLSGVWRFRDLLPALGDESNAITLREGNTPLYELPRCAKISGVPKLFAKHQGMNPTGSFKDTGMTVASTFAHRAGFRWVACASTGNTSASMAAYAARGNMRSLVLVPEGKISWSKLSQALDYGAVTCQLRTDFDGCLRLLQELVKKAPVYQLNSINPFRLEGQKTLAIELLEQLDWQPPDHIIVPGGNLGNSSAIGKALLEMRDLGLIARLPKLSVIQAEGANALVRTMRETGGKRLVSLQPKLATAIRIGNPASWKKAIRVIEATGGACEQVSEIEIAQAKAEIGAEGIGCEPASAVTLAGLKKLVAQKFVKPDEVVVLVLTGNLLKDPDYTIEFHAEIYSRAASPSRRSAH
jgi:threonine synthase